MRKFYSNFANGIITDIKFHLHPAIRITSILNFIFIKTFCGLGWSKSFL